MQASIDANDEKMKKIDYEFTDMKSEMTDIKTYLKHVLVQNQNSSPDHMDSLKDQDINYEVPDNKKAPPLEGRNPKKNGCMWTLKHEIISPKFYELLIKI